METPAEGFFAVAGEEFLALRAVDLGLRVVISLVESGPDPGGESPNYLRGRESELFIRS
jgi:hypothetical protein